jgi:hypothetical protein
VVFSRKEIRLFSNLQNVEIYTRPTSASDFFKLQTFLGDNHSQLLHGQSYQTRNQVSLVFMGYELPLELICWTMKIKKTDL